MGELGRKGRFATPQVVKNSFPLLRQWQRSYTIDMLLTALRQEMAAQANRRLPQPPEGELY